MLLVISLLALLALPALAGAKQRSELVTCFNNLRQIGHAIRAWSANNSGWTGNLAQQPPWLTPVGNGGTRATSLKNGNAWVEFTSLSNFLASPRVLACPSDQKTRSAAAVFGNTSQGGLYHASFRANSVSYFVGLHAAYEAPRSLLSGDWNLPYNPQPEACVASMIFGGVEISKYAPPGSLNWSNSIHGNVGNLLFSDGRVEETSNERLDQVLRFPPEDNQPLHVLLPK